MQLNKKVTILMPVYNSEKYLRESIDSILEQTFKEFDLLIINDGSTDKSEEIIKNYNDKRITYVINEKNIGIIKTLNKGLNLITSDYIVRMDSDDISLPTRIEKQICFMEKNLNIAVAGTSVLEFNSDGKKKKLAFTDTKQIRTELLFGTALYHPSVIIRNSVLKTNNYRYNNEHITMEDFGLWQKISFNYKLGNLKEVLLKYRINEEGITQTANKKVREQDCYYIKIYCQMLDHLNISYSEDELQYLRNFLSGRSCLHENENIVVARLLKEIKESISTRKFDLELYDKHLNRYYRNCCLNRGLTSSQSKTIYNKYFRLVFRYSFIEQLKYFYKKTRNILINLNKYQV